MNKEDIEKAFEALKAIGERTRALAIVEHTHDGQIKAFQSGPLGDIAMMGGFLEHTAYHRMLGPTPEIEKPAVNK